mmetsp:Transcript_980/g.2997  ORF Transcript_980/g.2997 Transcript_980/m.2997 type:complete len:214 (+) Transcript_980:2786-3427(+)
MMHWVQKRAHWRQALRKHPPPVSSPPPREASHLGCQTLGFELQVVWHLEYQISGSGMRVAWDLGCQISGSGTQGGLRLAVRVEIKRAAGRLHFRRWVPQGPGPQGVGKGTQLQLQGAGRVRALPREAAVARGMERGKRQAAPEGGTVRGSPPVAVPWAQEPASQKAAMGRVQPWGGSAPGGVGPLRGAYPQRSRHPAPRSHHPASVPWEAWPP